MDNIPPYADASPTLVHLLRFRAIHQSERTAYTFLTDGESEEVNITYGELDRKARAIGAWLQSLGAGGQRALLLYPPGPEYIAGLFGCFYAGVIAVPAYPPQLNRSTRRIETIMADSQATIALSVNRIISNVKRESTGSAGLNSLIWLSTEDLAINSAAEWREPPVTGGNLAVLQYTSGSTGAPKGVMLDHRNLLHNSALIKKCFEHTPDSRGMIWLPPYHDMGLIGGIIQPLYAGFPVTLMSPLAFLQKPLRWLQAISRYKATTSGGPDFAYQLCVRRISREQRATLDLKSWRIAFNGAEPIRAEILDEFASAFESCGFSREALYPCYGLAEASLMVSGGKAMSLPVTRMVSSTALENHRVLEATDDEDAKSIVGCGEILQDEEIVIVNPETLTPCLADQVGEIWVTSPSVARGYWGKPEETAYTFQAHMAGKSAGPFLRTGDLGFIQDGELFVTGRLKDLIIIRGHNHYPQDIEQTTEQSHSLVQQKCVAAFPVEAFGQEQLVIVAEVKRRLRSSMIDEVIGAIRQAVLEEFGIEAYAILLVKAGSIPKTSSGKIRRSACKAEFISGGLSVVGEWTRKVEEADWNGTNQAFEDQAASPRDDRTAKALRSWLIARIAARLGAKTNAIDINKPFAGYGLDSVAAIQLAADLEERLGHTVSPTLVYQYPSIETLARHLAEHERPSVEISMPEEALSTTDEPIAIIGIGCRFPGANNPESFWQLLRNGVDAITEVQPERWDNRLFYDPKLGDPGKMNTRWGGFVDNVDQFDPDFFGISALEAASMDPQQRLLLEVTWEALEDAGLVLQRLSGTKTGVFIGISTNDYSRIQLSRDYRHDIFWGTSNALSIAANRISYAFDLRGPSIAVDTACSSSLVAIHLASRSLLNGESTLAIAGGVNLILSPEITISFSQAGATSPDGRCKAFDAGANGIVRGEGAGVIILKPLSKALSDSDPIYAVIRGSAVNQDGSTNGIAAPNPKAQEEVLREAYRMAGVSPGQVDYVETHGTGTLLGDPIEAKALGEVLAASRPVDKPCAIGSVKTNIGHLEAAAGIAGVIKVALSLKHREIPPSLHFQVPNPHINFDELPFRVQQTLERWPEKSGAAIGGVSAFGFGGTNAHVVLESLSHAVREPNHDDGPPSSNAQLLALSARSPEALKALARAYVDFSASEDIGSTVSWPDICYAASVRRSHHNHRLALVFKTKEELAQRLYAFLQGKIQRGTPTGHKMPSVRQKLVFVFSGYGSQWPAMGRQLLEQEAVFKAAIEQCDELLRRYVKWSLLEELMADESQYRQDSDNVEVTQISLFAIQVALSALWHSWGVKPDAVVGHSMGEVAACCVSGALSLEDAIRLIFNRSRILQLGMNQASVPGAMAMVKLSIREAEDLLVGYKGRLSISAHNSPASTVLSGEADALDEVLQSLKQRRIAYRVMNTPGAGHSPQLESLREELVRALGGLEPQPESIPIFSSVTGKPAKGRDFNAEYWGANIAEPVLFSEAIESLLGCGFDLFLEISPDAMLTSSISQCLRQRGQQGTALPSLLRNRDEKEVILSSLGSLYTHGFPIVWNRLYPEKGQCVRLPSYPWQRKRYWIATEMAGADAEHIAARRNGNTASKHPFLGEYLKAAHPSETYYWEKELDKHHLSYLVDHRLQGIALLPSAAYIEMALAAAGIIFGPGPHVLTDAEFRRALFLSADGVQKIQAVLSRGVACSLFQVYSCSPESEKGADSWTLHASVKIHHGDDSTAELSPGRCALEDIQARCTEELAPGDFYRALDKIGVEYGESFRGIERLWRCGDEALAKVHVPSALASETSHYRFHPALLDACLQTLASTVPAAETTSSAPGIYLPVSASSIRYFNRPGERLWSYARRRSDTQKNTGVFEGDVQVLDESGRLVAEILGFRVQHLEHASLGSLEDSIYELKWEPEGHRHVDQVDSSPAQASQGEWLILADGLGVGKELAALMARAGEKCITVTAGMTYDQVDQNSYRISPTRSEDLSRLINERLAQSQGTCRGIIHLWSLDAHPQESITAKSLEASLAIGCGSVLGLVRGVVRAQGLSDLPSLWLVTQGAQQAGEVPCSISVSQAPLWGLGRTLAQEHSNLWGGIVDLDPESSPYEAALLLYDQVSNTDREDQVAFRRGKRYVARLTRKHEMPARSRSVQWRVDGTYLLTGGLGDLGLVVARWMVEQGARRLILLARTKLPPRSDWDQVESDSRLAHQISCIREMEAMGASVHSAQVDVSDEDQLHLFLQSFEQDCWPPIRGVVHLAGTVHGQTFLELDTDALIADFLPKAVGSWLLHTYFKDKPLDFFILFSSGASVLGSPFLGSYAAANAFLDALAHHRHSMGVHALSINWGFWSEAGMAARQLREYNRHLAPHGMKSITNKQGLEMLGRLLRQGSPQVAVMPFDWQEWRVYHPAAAEARLLAHLISGEAGSSQRKTHSSDNGALNYKTLLAAEPERQQQMLEVYLSDHMAKALGISESEVDTHQSLINLGIDSLMAVELKNRVEVELGVTLPMIRLLQGPSIAQLATTLLDQLSTVKLRGDESADVDATTTNTEDNGDQISLPSDIDPDSAGPLMAKLDYLSDDQVDRLLTRILAEEGGSE
jgi:acyl transferase domain-containing protein/acyl-CoA synthetase (AMP-forming)/AMP-acid ligase II/acyl carrier protein